MSRVNIVSLDEAIDDNGLKILVYAHAGAGKTVMAASAGQSTIMLSAEGGLLSLKKEMKKRPELKDLIKVIKIKSIDDLKDALDIFETSDVRLCNWIALDSISEITEVILKNEKENNKDARAAYGNLTDATLDLLRRFRDLPEYNVFMTAKMVRAENSDGETYYQPLFPGKGVGNNIPYLFDEVFALRIFEEEDAKGRIVKTRLLQTDLDTQYYAKDRSGELDDFEEPNLAHIYFKIRGFEEVDFNMDEDSKLRYAEKIKESTNTVTDSITWWRHIPTGECMEVEAGSDVSEMLSDDDIEVISEEDYLIATGSEVDSELLEDEESAEQEEDDTPVEEEEESEEDEDEDAVMSVRIQYWRHDPSDQCMKTEKDVNITELLSNDDVVEITKKEFDKWEASQPEDEEEEEEQEEAEEKEPPVHETKLQKAKRELLEQQANAKKKK